MNKDNGKPEYSPPSIERIAPFFASSAAKLPGFAVHNDFNDGNVEGADKTVIDSPDTDEIP